MNLSEIARLPHPTDNVAIATQTLPAGTTIMVDGVELKLDYTILVGHRFAIRPIPTHQTLTSWDMAFGTAISDIQPGSYVCNAGVLTELRSRNLDFALPDHPNFNDEIPAYQFNRAKIQPAEYPSTHHVSRTFLGYPRSGNRGVGTRNYIVLLGVNSHVTGFVRQLETELKLLAANHPTVDGIVAVAHTEGYSAEPNNLDLLLRTLNGFAVHPNVGAVLLIDAGDLGVTNAALQSYMTEHNSTIQHQRHHFLSLSGNFGADVAAAREKVAQWVEDCRADERTPQPISDLKLALQCGGSDAFSGVSGNPLISWVAKEVIRYGGAANLAETDELVGAEAYVLNKVRNADVAETFLGTIDRFKTRLGWHGVAVTGNPSGGNKYRGLYNIYLKSLGAATKRHPDTPLDFVIDYSAPMPDGGYYFMDSPGNDLESIAGQVASGSNLIFFVTGNGSITNFPFVPTLKVVTTTDRYNLLESDMDINAGQYLDGMPMDDLGAQTLDHTLDAASGTYTVGEKAGHSQVQLWRDWPRQATTSITLDTIEVSTQPQTPNAQPLPIKSTPYPTINLPTYQTDSGTATDQINLIMPTSLCSGQIAQMMVDKLNAPFRQDGKEAGQKYATLVHTEGCGSSLQPEYVETMLGYLRHPRVNAALLLEHGCEMTHNAFWRNRLAEQGHDLSRFGYASIQLDGGIDAVLTKMQSWFAQQSNQQTNQPSDLSALKIAVMSDGSADTTTTNLITKLSQQIVSAGGTVVVPAKDPLLPAFKQILGDGVEPAPTLRFAQQIEHAGLHVMQVPNSHWAEQQTGLGATGIELIIAVTNRVRAGHPMLPVFHLAANAQTDASQFDCGGDVAVGELLEKVVGVLVGDSVGVSAENNLFDFQITRGLLGVSL